MDVGQLKREGAWDKTCPSFLLLAIGQALETLLLNGVLTLVLEEDGTAVDSEDFFQLLEDDTCLMVLESGQSWSPTRVRGLYWGCFQCLSFRAFPGFLSSLTLILGTRCRGSCGIVKDVTQWTESPSEGGSDPVLMEISGGCLV